MVYSVKQKQSTNKVYALVHLEGQSTHHKEMALRVWQYHVAIASKLIQGEKYKKLPIIITYVLYHGKEKWGSAKSIAELWGEDAFEEYIKRGLKATFLYDLKSIPAEVLLSQKAASVPQYILHKQQEGEFCHDLPTLYRSMKKYHQDTLYNLNYISTLDKHRHAVFLEEIRKLDPEKASVMQVLFEEEIKEATRETAQREREIARIERLKALREATQKAKQERLKALTKVAQKMLKRGLNPEDIAKDFGLSLEDIKKLPQK